MAPASLASPMAVYDAYAPLWQALTPEASQKVRFGNYARLFDAARVKVRAWEQANVGKPRPVPAPTPSSGAGRDALKDSCTDGRVSLGSTR